MQGCKYRSRKLTLLDVKSLGDADRNQISFSRQLLGYEQSDEKNANPCTEG